MIKLERLGSVALLRLEHGKVNALDSELLTGLLQTLDEIERSSARAVVLTGRGSCFSAGVDLWRVLEGGPDYVEAFVPLLSQALTRLFSLTLPAVAAMNGHAIAGGCIIAFACDYRVMADGSGKVGVPELAVGVPFPAIAFEVVRSALPAGLFSRFVYLGELYEAEEAQRLGLIEEVVPPEDVVTRACQVGEQLAAIPADTYRATKRLHRQPILERAARVAEATDRELPRLWTSDEVMSATRSYMEATVRRPSRPR